MRYVDIINLVNSKHINFLRIKYEFMLSVDKYAVVYERFLLIEGTHWNWFYCVFHWFSLELMGNVIQSTMYKHTPRVVVQPAHLRIQTEWIELNTSEHFSCDTFWRTFDYFKYTNGNYAGNTLFWFKLINRTRSDFLTCRRNN